MQQAGTITADSRAASRFAAFGPRSLLAFPTGSLFGEAWIEIGDGNADRRPGITVAPACCPATTWAQSPVLRIGDRCVIGRGSHIVAHHSIVIGDDVYTGPYVYITDQNHGYADPNLPIGRQWPVNHAVSIGAGSWLGAGAIVLPGARIGRERGGRGRLGGPRRGARPVRGGGRPGPDCP